MAKQRLYGVFWINGDNRAMWALCRNGRQARRHAGTVNGYCLSMPLPLDAHAWDATTFKHCADRVEITIHPRAK